MRPKRALSMSVGALVVAGVAALAACATTPEGWGSSGDTDGDDGGAGPDGGSSSAPAAPGLSIFGASCAPGGPKVGWSPLRRISRVEYDDMVRDLLGDTTQPAQGFVPESPMTDGVNFETNTYSGVSVLIAQQYILAAEALAQNAVASASALAAILPCQTQGDACAAQFIGTFAPRAFRGPIDSQETASLTSIYTAVKTQFDFPTGIQAVITAVLESPRFLYVVELGDGTTSGGVTQLSAYEVAARLALFLWRSVPDATLMQAAAAGALGTPDAVAAQAARMLADPRARSAIDDFTTQWLELQSTPTLGKDTQFTAWNANPKLGAEMRDETLLDVSQLVLAASGTLPQLLTSPSSYVNADLAAFYGVPLGGGAAVTSDDPALGSATSFFATALPDRAGVLTSGSVLATQAHTTLPSSVLRGKLVREDVLCDPLPPPPPGIPPAPTSVPDGGTTRSVFQAHATTPGCVNCHEFMDPIGYGFGHFDATGAYQATDANGLPGTHPAIDATGQINAMNPGELQASYDGALDLVTRLAGATQAQECFALQELRYSLGRVESDDDACSAQQIWAAFQASHLNVQQLMIAIVRSDAFRYRSAEIAGSACQ